MKICVLQMPTLSMSESRIDYYLKIAAQNGAKIALLGEYVCNSFFTELTKMPRALIKEQSEHKNAVFTEFAKHYEIIIIAPLVVLKGEKFYKVMAKFSPKGLKFWEQKFLMNYPHWDEAKFFANDFKISSKNCKDNFAKIQNLDMPTFSFEGLKFGLCMGFEAHFDIVWQSFMAKNVDCVLIPTASTFGSNERWSELLKIRAFTNSTFIIRANRIGKAKFDEQNYEFYGESFAISPLGEIFTALKNEEGILMCEISKNEVKTASKLWKFHEILDKKGLI